MARVARPGAPIVISDEMPDITDRMLGHKIGLPGIDRWIVSRLMNLGDAFTDLVERHRHMDVAAIGRRGPQGQPIRRRSGGAADTSWSARPLDRRETAPRPCMRFFTLIVRNLLRRRGLRTALTVFGLAIGVSAVVSLLGISWGFERSFMTIYESKAIDLVVVKAGIGDRLTSNLHQTLVARDRTKVPRREGGSSARSPTSSRSRTPTSSVCSPTAGNAWQPPLPGHPCFDRPTVSLRRGTARSRGDARPGARDQPSRRRWGDSLARSRASPSTVVAVYESDSLFENGGLIVPLTSAAET